MSDKDKAHWLEGSNIEKLKQTPFTLGRSSNAKVESAAPSGSKVGGGGNDVKAGEFKPGPMVAAEYQSANTGGKDLRGNTVRPGEFKPVIGSSE